MFRCTSLQSWVLDVIMSLYPRVSVSDPASARVHVLLLWECSTVLLEVLVTILALANVPPGAMLHLRIARHHDEIRFSCRLSFWCADIIVLYNLQFRWKHSSSTSNNIWKKNTSTYDEACNICRAFLDCLLLRLWSYEITFSYSVLFIFDVYMARTINSQERDIYNQYVYVDNDTPIRTRLRRLLWLRN